jgi:septal ring factor EnvC (AmiA/AmiB activator)
MPTWAAILIGICGCTGIFDLVVAILQHRWSKRDKNDERLDNIESSLEALRAKQDNQDERLDNIESSLNALTGAERSSMEERIRYLVKHFMEKDEISMSELSNLRDMHKKYVGVGGNGNLDTEMELLDGIPVRG